MATLILIGTVVIGLFTLVVIFMLVRILVTGNYSLLLNNPDEEISLSPYCSVTESPENIFEWPRQESALAKDYSVIVSAQGIRQVGTVRVAAMAGR